MMCVNGEDTKNVGRHNERKTDGQMLKFSMKKGEWVEGWLKLPQKVCQAISSDGFLMYLRKE